MIGSQHENEHATCDAAGCTGALHSPHYQNPVHIKSPVRILHLEDNANDAALVVDTLQSEGIAVTTSRVQNREGFVAALEAGGVDLIISDFTLPSFDGMSAAKIARTRWPAIPFIFFSGTIGEERAVESLKNGATEYILKGQTGRLAPAVQRAMHEVAEREASRRLAETLQQTDRQLQVLFNDSMLGISLVGPDGRLRVTNNALQEMLGYTGEELSRLHFTNFTHPEDCARDMELYEELIQGKRTGYQIEKRFLHKDGHVIWARLSVSLTHTPGDTARFAIGMVEDITERRRLETQMIETQKMEVIGQLASGVAHDFNNILGVIIGYSDLVMPRIDGNDCTARGYMEEIREASKRATGLTRQLLVFSRKQTVQPLVLDLNHVVQDTEKMLRRLLDENIEMTLALEESCGRIKADPGYIGQVLMNLVVNARDAMPNSGKLTILTSSTTLDETFARAHDVAAGDYVRLSVTDTGTGMTDEVKAHIFEAFFTTKPKGKGTGLGLATCRTIVLQSNGCIDVSTELGKGTTFNIYFPRINQNLELMTRPAQVGPLPGGTETLLVVEDDPSVKHLACSILMAQGYSVLSASNGEEALRTAHQHKGDPISLVITDVIMPNMGGKVMSEWLKAKYPDLKILFTSGYTDDTIAQHGVLDTEFAFLSKPYTSAILIRKVRAMLDNLTDTALLRKLSPSDRNQAGPVKYDH